MQPVTFGTQGSPARRLPWWGTLAAAAVISAIAITVSLRLDTMASRRAHQSDEVGHLLVQARRLDGLIRSWSYAIETSASSGAVIQAKLIDWQADYAALRSTMTDHEAVSTDGLVAQLDEAMTRTFPAAGSAGAVVGDNASELIAASDALVGQISALDNARGAEASQAEGLATTGVVLLMGGAVLFAGGLAWGAERDRRSASLRVAEERLLRASEARFRALVQNSFDMITVLDSDGVVGYQSPASLMLLGRDAPDMVGHRLFAVVHPEDRAAFARFLSALRACPGEAVVLEVRLSHTNGTWRDMQIAGRVVESAFGAIVLNSRDISERTKLEESLRHQAFHDSLTGLANRALFVGEVSAAVATARQHDSQLAVLLLDMDGFKSVNDTFGHDVGDLILCEAARRISGHVERRGLVARLGGDEFAVLLQDLDDRREAEALAGRILSALREPMDVEGRTVYLGSSIGISLNRGLDDSVTTLLRQADVAMYAAKNQGRNRVEVFDEELQRSAMQGMEVATTLRRAFLEGEFRAFYQPIIDLRTGKLNGAEALVRWMKADGSISLPGDFIQVAEENGLIVEIGEWMLTEACMTLRSWQDRHGQLAPPTISVNVSPSQLHDAGFCATVERALKQARLRPQQLVIEVTEGTVIRDAERAASTLQQVAAMGVSIALDDFGTGYSSLSYLRDLPVHIVKIDKSFIDHLSHQGSDGLLLRAIIELAEALGLDTIAEGVERSEQLALLSRMGCRRAQGHLFSPALSAADFEACLLALPILIEAA